MASALDQAARPSFVRRHAPAVVVIVGVAVALRLIYTPYLNYDARYALLWARDLVRGLKPDYGADFAPTPHPLETVASMLTVPLGDRADTPLVWVILLAFGVLVWLTYRLGEELFGAKAIGAIAALVIATRPALQRDALLGYQDTMFAALIVGAVLLETRRPRRGAAVLGLLVLAGLMRPEAWVLGGLYWLWLWPASAWPRRIKLAGLVVVAPLAWIAMDAYVTGNPLHSAQGTADLAAAVDRRTDPLTSPYWTLQYLGYVLREPIVIGLPVGLFFAWRYRLRGGVIPLVAIAAMVAVFMIGPVFGLPLIGRYVRTPAVLLALFFALAVCGWLLLEQGRARRVWMGIGIALATLSVLFLPWHARMFESMRDNLAERYVAYERLHALADVGPLGQAIARCGRRVSSAERRALPHLRWWLDLPPYALSTVEADATPLQRVLIKPQDNRAMKRFYRVDFPRVPAPDGWRVVAGNGGWVAYADPGCNAK